MDMIRHHNPGMKLVVPHAVLPIEERPYHQFSNFWPQQVEWSAAGSIQKRIHGDKCVSGVGLAAEHSIRWQTAVETPGEKNRAIAPGGEEGDGDTRCAYMETVGLISRKFSGSRARPIANRPQDTILNNAA